jgi:hypothetical protein
LRSAAHAAQDGHSGPEPAVVATTLAIKGAADDRARQREHAPRVPAAAGDVRAALPRSQRAHARSRDGSALHRFVDSRAGRAAAAGYATARSPTRSPRCTGRTRHGGGRRPARLVPAAAVVMRRRRGRAWDGQGAPLPDPRRARAAARRGPGSRRGRIGTRRKLSASLLPAARSQWDASSLGLAGRAEARPTRAVVAGIGHFCCTLGDVQVERIRSTTECPAPAVVAVRASSAFAVHIRRGGKSWLPEP